MRDETAGIVGVDTTAELTPEQVEVYQALLEAPATATECAKLVGRPTHQVEDSLLALHRLCLVRRSLCEEQRWEAVAPELAIAEIVAPMHARVRQLTTYSEQIRSTLGRLTAIYQAAYRKQYAQSRTEVLHGGAVVRQRLRDLSVQAKETVVAVHPTMPPVGALRAGLELDRTLLERGVRYQVVWPHSARRQPESVDYMRLIIDLGAQVRTSAVLPARMIVLDSAVALIPLPASQGPGAAVVRDPVVLDFMSQIFRHIWEPAQPVREVCYDDVVVEEIERAILTDLAAGRTDEAIARRLGIATRTLRRYMSSLSERLGVETRFQLGIAAVRAGLIRVDGINGID